MTASNAPFAGWRCGVLILSGILVLGYCAAVRARAAELVDRIVAVVNNDIISLYELETSMGPYAERIKQQGYAEDTEIRMLAKVRENLLGKLINQKLTDQQIERAKIGVGDKEIDKTIERIRSAGGRTEEEFREALAKQGITPKAYRERIKTQLLRAKLVNLEVKSKIVITDDDIRSYYDRHIDTYRGEARYRLRNIIMKVPPLADPSEKSQVHQRMEALLEQLEAGRDFGQLAQAYSESSLAAEGGDLGFFKLKDLSPQLQDAIGGTPAGRYTPILDTEQGLQIFYVQEISREAGKSVEDAAPEIQEKLYQEIVETKFQMWLENLRAASHIKVID